MFKNIFLIFLTGSVVCILWSCGDKKEEDNSDLLLFLLNSLGSSNSAASTVVTSCKDASFCRTFVATNNGAGYDGNLGGISGADAKCAAAKSSNLTGTYKALFAAMGTREAVFVGDGSIDWVLYPNKQYRRSDGTTTTFTTNANSVVTANLQNSVDGGAEKFYWIGVGNQPATFDWEVSLNCNDWNSNNAVNFAIDGTGSSNEVFAGDGATPGGAFGSHNTGCNIRLNLLCVEQ
ncbi:PF07588 family protein [Leptospira interrogans str. FPW1039]|uniref:PF07588 family protein n=1 Tax=Leptospira interrogans str. FPW1039 TaxID=1193040 RepID=A0A0F6I8Y3_LEPIR|nr:DUF1554 domain-containing protein [Leptospira interrogans]EMJ34508.1 PF07588 family protein [Leptospira interrogans str. FPW1039]